MPSPLCSGKLHAIKYDMTTHKITLGYLAQRYHAVRDNIMCSVEKRFNFCHKIQFIGANL